MYEIANILFFKKFFLKILVHVILVMVILVDGHGQNEQHNQEIRDSNPEFLAPLDNLTATQGRDVSFTCVVNDLGSYRVAWIKSDSKAILAIHTHMVALNARLSVTHNGHNTWKLHIAHVQLNDSGSYMCQVNTDPMRSQSGYLDVVVPPDILNQPDSSNTNLEEGITNEGGTVQLVCKATGVPAPSVIWKREGGKDIVLRHEGREKQVVKHVDGDRLIMHQVQRTEMGGYLCIASNGVPPSVSKRFDVHVNFSPSVKAVNQLVGAPVESHVLLQCIVEAYSKPLNGWYKTEGVKLYEGPKYIIAESMINTYTWQMNLTVKNLQKNDFGTYICTSVNALGKADERINLQELRLEPKHTTPTPYVALSLTTAKPKKKNHQSHKDKSTVVDNNRIKETQQIPNHIQENDISGIVEAHTQPPIRSSNNIEKTRNTQMPASVPSQRPPWVQHNGDNSCWCSQHNNYVSLLLLSLVIVTFFNCLNFV